MASAELFSIRASAGFRLACDLYLTGSFNHTFRRSLYPPAARFEISGFLSLLRFPNVHARFSFASGFSSLETSLFQKRSLAKS